MDVNKSVLHTPLLNFILLDERWKKLVPSWQEEASLALEKTVTFLEKDFSKKEVSIVLTDDKHVQDLNKTFRHWDKPTNVLSFPSEEESELGDIILAYETVRQEALEASLSPLHHMIHLIIHGFLHLLGYDHEKEEDAHKMETLEIQILQSLSIDNPYEER